MPFSAIPHLDRDLAHMSHFTPGVLPRFPTPNWGTTTASSQLSRHLVMCQMQRNVLSLSLHHDILCLSKASPFLSLHWT
jgi:hypothetical protein